MDKEELTRLIQAQFAAAPGNDITPEDAIDPALAGVRLYDPPLLGFGDAADGLFDRLRQAEAVGPWYLPPREWMPQARTVVSLFFPFSLAVRKSNRGDAAQPSALWLHGRIEGQSFIAALMRQLCGALEQKGITCCIPAQDPRFALSLDGKGLPGFPADKTPIFTSNWSERHAAYVCGLGSFGLSGGIITEKGMAGRLASMLLDIAVPPDTRAYTDIYANCIRCGLCQKRCPVEAISPQMEKSNVRCKAWLLETKARYAPRLGCGKCQTAVPCEDKNPARKKEQNHAVEH